MSELVLQESSAFDDAVSSSDDELNRINKEVAQRSFKKLIKSKNNLNQRLLD